MGRRIWIILKKDQVEQSDIDAATANNCPEIVNGIPPALQGIVSESDLPMAYEEPEPIAPEPTPPLCTHWAIIKSFNIGQEKPVRVKRTWDGKEYSVDCYVSEAVKDQYQSGDILIADYVLVEFLDGDPNRAVVFAKVFKTW